jgi:hypothetical protein
VKNIRKIGSAAVFVAAAAMVAQSAFAAVSPEEAKALGAQMTKFGADAGKNADGSIPAYTGGLKSLGRVTEGEHYKDPFADEKPLYSITSKNMGEYEGLLNPGTQALIKRYPTYRVDVYPTHRTMTYPDWFADNSVKNATTAKIAGEIEGDKVIGSAPDGMPFQGIPFPVPKTGYEVMWNYKLRFAPAVSMLKPSAWLVDSGGTVSELPGFEAAYLHPWSDQSGKLRKETYDSYFGFSTRLTSPPTSNGIHFLNYYTPDAASAQPVWIYTPGQRRVRKAPEFAYDIPIAAYAGILMWDEFLGFQGRMDRFSFKLVGKKEMIVPYNTFGMSTTKAPNQIVAKDHVNPDAMRWEKRRVWVVESTRKDGVRHAYSRRNFYVEEDCWCIVATESFDNAGKLWRVSQLFNFPVYDVGGMNNEAYLFADLIKGNYFVANIGRGDKNHYVVSYPSSEGLNLVLTPGAISGGSSR